MFFFPHLVIRDCGSYRKFQREFGVLDSSPKQDYVLFLRFEDVGNKDVCVQALNDGDTAIKGLLLEMYSDYQKCVYG